MTCTQDRFLKEVATHEMQILHESGVYRHIRFKRPGTGCMHFDLITYPGFLVYSGDMGCYVFSRLHDMFEFFRTNRRGDDGLYINLEYWSEKLQATDSNGGNSDGVFEFSPEEFRQYVKKEFDGWVELNQPDSDDQYTTKSEIDDFNQKKEELWADLEAEVLSKAEDGEVRAIDAAMNFVSSDSPLFLMDDCWEWDCKEYKHRFIWCCYAIAWAIKKYDEEKGATK